MNPDQHLVKLASHLLQGLSPVADPVLLFPGQLGKRFVERWKKENRIISESVFTGRRLGNDAFTAGLIGKGGSGRHGNRYHALKGCFPVGISLHFVEKLFASLLIRGIFTGISGRVNPRSPGKRRDHQAGIIGQGRHAQNPGYKTGLLVSVFFKAFTVFFHRRNLPEILKILDFHGKTRQKIPDFSCFSLIARCDDKRRI